MNKTKILRLPGPVALLTWVASGAILIATGFAVDGITQAGHHAFLILGGIATGFGIARSRQR